MGTWKLNEAKSHFAAGAAKNNIVVYEAAGFPLGVVIKVTDAHAQRSCSAGCPLLR